MGLFGACAFSIARMESHRRVNSLPWSWMPPFVIRLDAIDLESCEQQCLSRDECVAMEFYVVGLHTQTGTNCKLIQEGSLGCRRRRRRCCCCCCCLLFFVLAQLLAMIRTAMTLTTGLQSLPCTMAWGLDSRICVAWKWLLFLFVLLGSGFEWRHSQNFHKSYQVFLVVIYRRYTVISSSFEIGLTAGRLCCISAIYSLKLSQPRPASLRSTSTCQSHSTPSLLAAFFFRIPCTTPTVRRRPCDKVCTPIGQPSPVPFKQHGQWAASIVAI